MLVSAEVKKTGDLEAKTGITFSSLLFSSTMGIISLSLGQFKVLGKPFIKKSAVFFNIVQKAFDPPPLYLNICPILQGVFFKTRF